MKYFINYTEQGKILGFTKGDTGLNIEVSNTKWVEGQRYNKIIVEGNNITFEKVDWHTYEEIQEQEQYKTRLKRNNLLDDTDKKVARYRDEVELDIPTTDNITKLINYRQYLRDITSEDGFPYNTIKTYEEYKTEEMNNG